MKKLGTRDGPHKRAFKAQTLVKIEANLQGYEVGLSGITWKRVRCFYNTGSVRWHAWLEGWRKGRYHWYLNRMYSK